MHDAGHTNQGLAALRHHKRKRLKLKNTGRNKKGARKTFAVRHNNKILVRTAARKARHVFFFVLANVSSMLYVFTGVELHNSWRFHISLRNVEDECILFEKFA